VNFRRFEPQDAAFCFKVRSNAFIQKFYGELTPVEVSAGVNSYMPDAYIRMSEEMPFFISKEHTFCNLSGLKVKALRLCKQIDQ
jgi:hypothetical protein